jgi:quercetin dioxygenase-like cupin family protein
LEYQVEGELFLLETGDSLLFEAQLKHRWHNPGGVVTNALIIISDYSDADQPLAHMEKLES